MAADPSKFNGRFLLVSSENFDAYMKALGVGFALRTIGNTLKPTLEFAVNADGTWTIKTISTFRNSEDTFKLNEEGDEETPDGRKVRTTFTFENGKLFQRQKATKPNEKDSEIIRELVGDDGMLTTLTVHGDNGPVIATRKYKRE